LLSDAPTNPMGTPTTSAGLAAEASMSRQSSNRAVGAFPMATIPPSISGAARRIAAAERVIPSRPAISAVSASLRKHSVSPPAASTAALRTPALTISTSVRMFFPARTARIPAATAPSLITSLRAKDTSAEA